MKTITPEELKKLYEKDFVLWVEKNLELLREKAYELMDWENLLEEIQDMARRHFESTISYLAVILEHLYKWETFRGHTSYAGKGGNKWIDSIRNARDELNLLFRRYPSLKVKVSAQMQEAWEEAKVRLRKWLREEKTRGAIWIKRARINPESYKFPEECPYTFKQAMEYTPWEK